MEIILFILLEMLFVLGFWMMLHLTGYRIRFSIEPKEDMAPFYDDDGDEDIDVEVLLPVAPIGNTEPPDNWENDYWNPWNRIVNNPSQN